MENAFWFAHRALNLKVTLLHGPAYDMPSLVQPVDIGVMGNILQHLRGPFRAIERVAQVVTETLIITEAVWDADEAFLASPTMQLIPRADTPDCNHSWWLVSPRSVIEMLRLLGFPQVSLAYHHQKFVATASDARARLVKHFTVTGRRAGGAAMDRSTVQHVEVEFPADTWHAEERESVHHWRWSSKRTAIIPIRNLDTREHVVSIACGVASLQPDRIELRSNGSTIWSGDVVGLPTQVFVATLAMMPGLNTLEFCAGREPSRAPSDTRLLGLAVYDLTVSPVAR